MTAEGPWRRWWPSHGKRTARASQVVTSSVVFGSLVMVQDTTGNVDISLPAPVSTALASLPPVPAGFTGRDQDLAELLEALASGSAAPAGAGAAVSVAGLPGVGKTSLALAAAHAARTRGWFAGTLFVDLRGYDESPVEPSQALERLLCQLGVAQPFPPTLEERQGLYLSRLSALATAGRGMLVVADNASHVEQVRPLLPAHGQHRLLVTSRDRLPTFEARLIELHVLTPEAAVRVLDAALRITDPADSRITSDIDAAQTLAMRCGYLPLALRIASARLIADMGQQAAALAAELEEIRSRLELLDDGERAIRASFYLSYRHLPAALAETFRLLGLNPGVDISTETAAVLSDAPPEAVKRLLTQLTQAHLLGRGQAQGRWRMHDLIHAYAGEQARAHARGHPRVARTYQWTQRRLLEHYTAHAEAASTHFDPDPAAARSPRFSTRRQAADWLDVELPNVIAAFTGPMPSEQKRIILHLPRTMGSYLNAYRYLDEWLIISQTAVQVARELSDEAAEGVALEACGTALSGLRRMREAEEVLNGALEISRRTRNRDLEALTLTDLGNLANSINCRTCALDHHRKALKVFQSLQDERGEAAAWSNLALSLMFANVPDEVLNALDRADSIYRRLGDEDGSAKVLMTRGIALGKLRRFNEAITCFRTTAAAWRERHQEYEEASALSNLSWTLLAARKLDEAIVVSRSAVEISRRVAQNSHGEIPSLGFVGALNAYAEALYRSRKNLSQAAASINEALTLLEQIPHPGGHLEAAHFTAIRILKRLRRGRKNAKIRRQLSAHLGPTVNASVQRQGRWTSRWRGITLLQTAWVAVVWCGFFHARQANTSVWLLILYCVAGLIATGFIKIKPRTKTQGSLMQTGHPSNMEISCMPRLLPALSLVVSLSIPQMLGPFNTAGDLLVRMLGLS
ncbi:tetratricopeptide repeat protein [Streptomyces hiroshimensis]|uniref:Tetratricopeptide repeat protein n=1 Tax=Streptomyces hiroshimensis TaxID=66424 RepID=A0ABQ2Y8Y6_9ACTN|nr:tetratricopeptide repeat protein [Streptomyces hiroshimensis]GGX75971.1 hypothetical protein GCM10010324_21890 [Streptomyces hiroshimensis]